MCIRVGWGDAVGWECHFFTITSPYFTRESTPAHLRMGGQPYARVDLNPMPESTLSPSQGLWIWLLYITRTRIVSKLLLECVQHAARKIFGQKSDCSSTFLAVLQVWISSPTHFLISTIFRSFIFFLGYAYSNIFSRKLFFIFIHNHLHQRAGNVYTIYIVLVFCVAPPYLFKLQMFHVHAFFLLLHRSNAGQASTV